MVSLLQHLKIQYVKHRAFLTYGFISVFVTLLDMIASRASEYLLHNAVWANTIGVVTGFIVQYFLTARHVYNSKNKKTFFLFLVTFFIGLLLANGIVFICRSYLFHGSGTTIAFLVSKGFSIVIPFFFIYYLRKKLIGIPAEPIKEEKGGK